MKKYSLFLALFVLSSCQVHERVEDTALERGRFLYEEHCASCHGVKGDGQGPVAKYLWPKPRDLTKGILKYRSTEGPHPSDYDIIKTMKDGVPGTSMPGWDLLKASDWGLILNYIKKLAPRLASTKPGSSIPIPKQIPKTPASIEAGRQLYQTAGCVDCHGITGRGDGPAHASLKDVWGYRVMPRDLTRGPLKWGNTERDIYRSILRGIPTTPMPSYGRTMQPDQIWQLVHYVQSIQKMPAGYDPYDSSQYVQVKYINGDLPLDFQARAWQEIKAAPVYANPLWNQNNATEWIMVKALYNKSDIAFYLSWADDKSDTKPNASDGVAIQFPTKVIPVPAGLPYIGMGSAVNPVQILEWKPLGMGKFDAQGINALTPLEVSSSQFSGKGIYRAGRWHVIIKHSLKAKRKTDIDLRKIGYLALAIWDADIPRSAAPQSFTEWMVYKLEGQE